MNYTNNILDKYSRARLLSERTEQIANGSPSVLKNPGTSDPYTLAKMELESGNFPIKLVKVNSKGEKEIWDTKDMILV